MIFRTKRTTIPTVSTINSSAIIIPTTPELNLKDAGFPIKTSTKTGTKIEKIIVVIV
ncbi:MAG TPA: hypothetical protein VEP90_11580 [Methylomirabilota bacterium]|nr:hypothetical protein [Methylomirabilota bacterium]